MKTNYLDKIKKTDKNIWILSLIFIVITPFFLTPWIHGNDGAGYYSYLHSVFIDHNLDFKNEREHFNQTQFIRSIDIDPNTGKHFIQYPIGTSLLWSPYFIVGGLIAYIAGIPTDGYSMPYVYMVCLGSAINAFIGLILSYLILKKYFDKKIAMLSSLTVWLASSLFYYMYFESSVSHANAFFAFTLFIYYWHKTINNRTIKQWIIIGLLAALSVLVRYQNIILLALPLVEVLYKGNVLKEIKKISFSALTFFIVLLPQMILLKIKHGTIIVSYSGDFDGYLIPKQIFNVLFSSQHGLFNWTPILFLGIIGLFIFYKKNKIMAISFLALFILNLIIVSGWNIWYAGQSFGHRMFVDMTLIFMFGFAALIQKLNKKIKFIYLVLTCILLVAWNLGLMVQYGTRMIDSSASVSFKERFYNNLFVVPKKLIATAKMFIFERGAFLR